MADPGGLAQARHVFLAGCGLPAAWAGQPQWRILQTGFGNALNLLAAWRAWKDDPRRPRILHFVAIEVRPPAAAELLRGAQPWAELEEPARELARQWYGLLPGIHRLVFEQGRVLLTLAVGETGRMLREQDFHADSVFLDTLAPDAAKALARCCRRGTGMAGVAVDGELGAALAQQGFALREGAALAGEFAPRWEPRGPRAQPPVIPGDCLVIGAGLAGAAAAASLARRGWRVRVLDAAAAPAAGASALPAGVLAPHSSPDDNLLSRLSRDGARATLQQAQALLVAGRDWEASGILEHHIEDLPDRGARASQQADVWSRPADAQQKRLAGLDTDAHADWHEKSAWIQPARLVNAWLAQPGVELTTGAAVAKLVRSEGLWQALDTSGRVLGRGGLVIVAAAWDSHPLLPGLQLQPVRGQVSWGLAGPQLRLPPFPVNGDGSFIPRVPTAQGDAWLCGSSFSRGETDLAPRAGDHAANLQRLRRLLPDTARQLEPAFAGGAVQAWTGIRCASTDRRPLVGPVDADGQGGLWVSTAMGSRGLSFAALGGELIAARLHGEPLPLARKLALALAVERQKR